MRRSPFTSRVSPPEKHLGAADVWRPEWSEHEKAKMLVKLKQFPLQKNLKTSFGLRKHRPG